MPGRRRPGIQGIQRTTQQKENLKKKADEIEEQTQAHLEASLAKFKDHLETFATKYRKRVQKDPEFRMHFQNMCTKIGVDTLASQKGFWSDLLGIGDFYYELAVQVAEVCLASRERTGGIVGLDEVMHRVKRMRGSNSQPIGRDDVERAVGKLKTLNGGFKIIGTGAGAMVQSVPCELSGDHNAILQMAESGQGFSASAVETQLSWTHARVTVAINELIKEGMIWIDLGGGDEPLYWVPALANLGAA